MKFKAIKINQYDSGTDQDQLIIFAAPAKELVKWAGVPRKGWHIRMLYQRWMTQGRETELKEFWEKAATPGKYILGPTAITIALQDEPIWDGDEIVITSTSHIDPEISSETQLAKLADLVLPKVVSRLTDPQRKTLELFKSDLKQDLPDVSHDYVFEFAFQLLQMKNEPKYFIDENGLTPDDLGELISALDSLSKPALVVDGQHRLIGAAMIASQVNIPVIVVPKATWLEQVYQFIVINEKAQKVDTGILTDIFGSSLTEDEQAQLRIRLDRTNIDVFSRVAAVIANRDLNSPFYGKVKLRLQSENPSGNGGYISDTTIRLLIDGRSRSSAGWRSDEDFYKYYIQPTFPDRDAWESWSVGTWREYWFAFWSEVRDFYNTAGMASPEKKELWTDTQTNLTKAVTLRLFQRLFMEEAVQRVKDVARNESVLIEALGPEVAKTKLEKMYKDKSIPDSIIKFREDIRTWFFEKGIPVRVFLKEWQRSLDDQQGQENLYKELSDAWRLSNQGRRYHAQNNQVFAIPDQE